MTFFLRFALGLTVVGIAGCSCDGPRVATQVIVIVDADEFVRSNADLLRVEVFGGPAEPAPAFPEEPKENLSFPVARDGGWPRTLALVPEGRDPTRIYRVVATATGAGDEVVAVARVISGYVAGDVRTVRVYLTTACAPEVCDERETCDEVSEMCRDAEVDPEDLPPYRPDAGVMDAGPFDVGLFDGGAPDARVPDGGTACTCDDGIACTVDACDAEGVCRSMPSDALCDDGNPCTADACGATGCSNDATPGVACDDDVFCNGADTCGSDGGCAHAGDPCAGIGSLTCDEAVDMCDGPCADDDGCPSDSAGPFTACVYAGGCAENGSRVRELHDWACEASGCVETVTSETDAGGCDRPTAGDPCGSECDPFGPCMVSGGPCSMSGVAVRACRVLACQAGTCSGVASETPDSMSCFGPSTDGISCGGCFTCSAGTCSNGSACDAGGLPDAGQLDVGFFPEVGLPDSGGPPDAGLFDVGFPPDTGSTTARDGGGAIFTDATVIE